MELFSVRSARLPLPWQPYSANCSRGQLDVPPRAQKAAPHSKISYLSKKESGSVDRNGCRLLGYF
jgi:hypothetical protein